MVLYTFFSFYATKNKDGKKQNNRAYIVQEVEDLENYTQKRVNKAIAVLLYCAYFVQDMSDFRLCDK